jgi:hypothetical protein
MREPPEAGDLLVERRQRRALIARHERPRPQAGASVGAVLIKQQPDERLHPGQEDAAVRELVAVGEDDR